MILATSISESVLSWRATPEGIKESLFIHSTNTEKKNATSLPKRKVFQTLPARFCAEIKVN